jgi:hypothetical protein
MLAERIDPLLEFVRRLPRRTNGISELWPF